MSGCPKCGSYQYESNKIEEVPFTEIGHGVHTAKELGHPVVAASVFAFWCGIKAFNACRHQWRCLNCGHRFNDD